MVSNVGHSIFSDASYTKKKVISKISFLVFVLFAKLNL